MRGGGGVRVSGGVKSSEMIRSICASPPRSLSSLRSHFWLVYVQDGRGVPVMSGFL